MVKPGKAEMSGKTGIDTNLDLVTLLNHKLQGMTYKQIGAKYGITKQAVHQRLQRIYNIIDEDQIDLYEKRKSMLLSAAESEILNHLVNPVKLQKEPPNKLAYTFSKVHECNRLERGQATQIVDHGTLSKEIAELERKLAQYEEKERNTIDISDAKDAGETPQDIVSEVPDNFLQKQESNDINELRDE